MISSQRILAALLALALLPQGCRNAGLDPDPAAGRAEYGLRLRFSDASWANVILDSLVISGSAGKGRQETTITHVNPAVSSVRHTITGYSGEEVSIAIRFHKSGHVIAESFAKARLGGEAASLIARARIERLPAWDSLVPPLPDSGRLAFDRRDLDLSSAKDGRMQVALWNRNPDSLDWGISSQDPWIRVEPEAAFRMAPGADTQITITVLPSARPSARLTGALVFATPTGPDTLRLRYMPRLAPGQCLVRGRVSSRIRNVTLPASEVVLRPLGDTARSYKHAADSAGEFAWTDPDSGRYLLEASAAGHLLHFDTVTVRPGDTALLDIPLLSVPPVIDFDFGLQGAVYGPAAAIGSFWVAATRGIAEEGRIVFVSSSNPSTAAVRSIALGNTDGQGNIFLVQEMVGDDTSLYFSYPADFTLVRVENWKGPSPRYMRVTLPFRPFGMALDGGRLLVAGADSGSNTVLGVMRRDSLVVETVVALPGMRSEGTELGIWGPKVEVGAGKVWVVEGKSGLSANQVACLRSAELNRVLLKEVNSQVTQEVALIGERPVMLAASSNRARIYFLEDTTFGTFLQLPIEANQILPPSGKVYKDHLITTGAEGEVCWVDASAKRMVLRQNQTGKIWLWDENALSMVRIK